MAHSKSAKKRIRQSEKARIHNRHYRSMMKTFIKRVLAAPDKTAAEAELRTTVALLDKLASKRIIHRNKAANQKSRLTRYVNQLT